MPQIQRYDQRIRENAMPDIAAGPQATAEAFGAGSARDVLRLGGAFHELGIEAIRQSQVKQRVKDEAILRDKTTQLHADFARESQAIYQKKGIDAQEAEREVAELAERLNQSAAESFTTQEQRIAWDKRFSSFKTAAVEQAISFSAKEMWEYDRATYEDQNMQHIRTAQEVEEKFKDSPEERDREQKNALEMTLDNVDKLTQGMPEESRQLARIKAAGAFHAAVVKTRGLNNPAAALEYLEREDVKAVFTPLEVAAMKEQYSQTLLNNDINKTAMSWVDAGFTSDETFRMAYTLYPDDPEKPENAKNRQQLLWVYDNYSHRKADAANTRAARFNQQVWQGYAAAGYQMDKMPVELQEAVTANPKLYRELLAMRETLNKMEREGAIPDFEELDRIYNMQPSEIRAWLAAKPEEGKASNWSYLTLWAAGRKDQIDRIVQKSNPEQPAAGAGGGGRGSLDIAKAFMQNFGAMNEKGWFWKEPAQYDPKNPEHVGKMNNFTHLFSERLNAERKRLERNLGHAEETEVFYQLITDINAGREKLDRPTYTRDWERHLNAENPTRNVSATELSEADRKIHRGEKVMDEYDAASGAARRWGILNVNSDDDNTGVFADIKDTARSAKVAYGSGVLTVGDRTLHYEQGWRVVVMKHSGYTKIYDRQWNMRDEAPPPQGRTFPKRAESDVEDEAPVMSKAMEADMDELRRRHPAGTVTHQWLGHAWQVTYPGGARTYSRNGALVDEMPTGIESLNQPPPVDFDDKPPPVKSEEVKIMEEYHHEVGKLRSLERELDDLQRSVRLYRDVFINNALVNGVLGKITKQKEVVKKAQDRYAALYGRK